MFSRMFSYVFVRLVFVCLFAYLFTFCAHDNKHTGLKIHRRTRVNTAARSIILDRCASYVAFSNVLARTGVCSLCMCVRHYRNRCAETFVSVSALRDLLGLHSKKSTTRNIYVSVDKTTTESN